MTPIPVIIDCDPGIDDALALLLAAASPALDLRAVTVVAGNQTLPRTLHNCLTVLDYAGIRHVPVAAGADRPLVRDLLTAGHVHGESGLGDLRLPEPARRPEPVHAVDLIARVLRAADAPVTLIPVGPLTNIALLLLTAPELHPRIARIVLMGGSLGAGNVTPAAEFNIYVDPEAARIVFRSGLPLTMVGLDVTHQAPITPDHSAGLRASGRRVAGMAADLLDSYGRFYGPERRRQGLPVHDALAVAAVVEPALMTTRPYYVDVETRGELTTGQTVADRRETAERPANVEVAVGVDAERFAALLLDGLRAFP